MQGFRNHKTTDNNFLILGYSWRESLWRSKPSAQLRDLPRRRREICQPGRRGESVTVTAAAEAGPPHRPAARRPGSHRTGCSATAFLCIHRRRADYRHPRLSTYSGF